MSTGLAQRNATLGNRSEELLEIETIEVGQPTDGQPEGGGEALEPPLRLRKSALLPICSRSAAKSAAPSSRSSRVFNPVSVRLRSA
ncbi:MAG: hypothetical protein U0841_24070 [Chloroflexia bacterium]